MDVVVFLVFVLASLSEVLAEAEKPPGARRSTLSFFNRDTPVPSRSSGSMQQLRQLFDDARKDIEDRYPGES